MPALADLVNDLIALIPEDGSRITNDEIRAALEREAGEPISDEELKELKSQVLALGAAEGVKGPGGGLRAPGIDPPPRTAAPAAGTRTRRSGNGATPATPSTAIAPVTSAVPRCSPASCAIRSTVSGERSGLAGSPTRWQC